MPWILIYLIYMRVSRFVVFQTKVGHLCFCLVRIKMPLLICRHNLTSNPVNLTYTCQHQAIPFPRLQSAVCFSLLAMQRNPPTRRWLLRPTSQQSWRPDGHARWETPDLSGPVRDTPPYRAIPFRDSVAEGGIAPICLAFIGYRASIAEIPPFEGGYRTSPSHALQGGNAQKRGRGYRTQLAMLRHQKPHSAQ